MEKNFVVRKKTTTEDAEGETKKIVLTPNEENIEKQVKLEIQSEEIAEKLGIPTDVNDTVLIEFGKTNTQKNLDDSELMKEIDDAVTTADVESD